MYQRRTIMSVCPASAKIKYLIVLALLAVTLGGCASGYVIDAPLVRFDADGRVIAYKRYEPRPVRNFIHHFKRQVYQATDESFIPVGEAQTILFDQWGRPNYKRPIFKTIQGEPIEEWIYFDMQKVFQFYGDELVFDGPYTDYEDLLLRHGYPDYQRTIVDDLGVVEDFFQYKSIFFPWRFDNYIMIDGAIVNITKGDD